MRAKTVNHPLVNIRFTALMALFAGLFGLGLLFLPDMDFVAILLSTAAFGLMFSGDQYYSEIDRQRIRRSAETAFQWLFLGILSAYALMALFNWLHIAGSVVSFAALHWPALTALSMSIMLGSAVLRQRPV